MYYYVIAIKWDTDKGERRKYIAGTFETFINASIFQKAYNEYFKANAEIVTADKLVND